MREIYIEWFLLDNMLMAYLIIRTAAVLVKTSRRWWGTALTCIVSAGISAAAMVWPFFLSLEVKFFLLIVMTIPFRVSNGKQWLFAAGSTLLSTFMLGGLAYATAFFFESDFSGGVLYASGSVRVFMIAIVISLWIPKAIRKLTYYKRLRSYNMNLRIQTDYGFMTLDAQLDTGHSLTASDECSVIIVDARKAKKILPPQWVNGQWQEHTKDVPKMGVLPFRTVNDYGLMPTIPAQASWRSEDTGNSWEVFRHCHVAVAPQNLQNASALVGVDWA